MIENTPEQDSDGRCVVRFESVSVYADLTRDAYRYRAIRARPQSIIGLVPDSSEDIDRFADDLIAGRA